MYISSLGMLVKGRLSGGNLDEGVVNEEGDKEMKEGRLMIEAKELVWNMKAQLSLVQCD